MRRGTFGTVRPVSSGGWIAITDDGQSRRVVTFSSKSSAVAFLSRMGCR